MPDDAEKRPTDSTERLHLADVIVGDDDSPAPVAGHSDMIDSTESATSANSPDAPAGAPRKAWLMPSLILAGLFVVLGGAYLMDWLATKDEIARGTRIAGVEVGGLTPGEALTRLEAEFGAVDEPMELTVDDTSVVLDPAAAGLTSDLPASVEAVGTRSANPFSRLGALFGATTDHDLVTAVDTAGLTAALTGLAEQNDVAPVEGEVRIEGAAVVAVAPVTGQHLDVPAAISAVSSAWTSGNPLSTAGLALPVSEQPVRASAEGVARARQEAEAILAGPLTVVGRDLTFAVPVEALAAATSVTPDAADGFTVTLDPAALRTTLDPQLAPTETTPVNASISIVNGAPTITPSVDGYTIDWTATTTALDAAVRSPEHALTVVYSTTAPELTTEGAQALGVREVVAEFTTGGFAYDSGQNVKRAAEEVNGAIVVPGETFSLNGHTGPRGSAQGYVEAGIIRDGVADRAVGGGISQFATTLYNASFFAGMEDIEHQPHSYYISRYPAGREATVFQAQDGTSIIDVKFRNVHPTAVLIETVWTPSNITVRMWGTKTVDVESISGGRYNVTQPRTKTIPYGESCSASSGTNGFSIDVTRVIRDLAGNEISRETQTTVYNGQMKIVCAPPASPTSTAETTTGG